MTTKRCGTCRHWDGPRGEFRDIFGEPLTPCGWCTAVPFWMLNLVRRHLDRDGTPEVVSATAGEHCGAWQPKEPTQ